MQPRGTILNLHKTTVAAANVAIKRNDSQVAEVSPPASSPTAPAGVQASEIQPLDLRAPLPADVFEEVRAELEIPAHWSKGALLNVRNRGVDYCITLYPEEFDPRYPERAMLFPNSWTCQDFVSRWYQRENPDPRAR